MNNTTRLARLKEKDYQKIFGVTKTTFDQMLEILEETYRQEHRRGGHPPKLSVLDKLVIMLGYYRDYRTMESIAFDYNALIDDLDIKVVFVDATECEIERPQKNRNDTIPGRKKDIR